MVFYYESVKPHKWLVFMGRDKYENEELLKYAFPEDIWFHVDNLSSAHVYLRRPSREVSIDNVPQEILAEMAQLVKANSIEGSKREQVDVVYCEYGNLYKGKSFEAGAVAYKEEKNNRYLRGVKKDKDVLKRIEKTMTEPANVDLRALREDRDAEEQRKNAAAKRKAEKQAVEDRKKEKEKAEVEGYVDFMRHKELKTSNKDEKWAGDGSVQHCKQVEDDFM
jgi:hypothetical protein